MVLHKNHKSPESCSKGAELANWEVLPHAWAYTEASCSVLKMPLTTPQLQSECFVNDAFTVEKNREGGFES